MRLHHLINIAHDLIAVNILRGQELPALAGRDWARHIRYAREELRRQMVHAPRWEIGLTRLSSAQAARVIARSLISPRVYVEVGLDPKEALAAAAASPHRQEVMRQSAKRLMDFFDEIGLFRGPSRRLWNASGLLPA